MLTSIDNIFMLTINKLVVNWIAKWLPWNIKPTVKFDTTMLTSYLPEETYDR